MRSVILFIALLAAAKLGWQEYVYRSALTDALVDTFRQDAIESCSRESRQRNIGVGYDAWSKPESIELTVGQSSERPAAAATTSRSSWASGPYLVLVALDQASRVGCEYDVMRQAAAVFRM